MEGLIKKLFKTVLWLVAMALLVGGVLRILFVHQVVTTHNAMAPTILAGDSVLVWRGATPEMGDIALCEHPARPGELVMGRVVGKPGMTLQSTRGKLDIEGTVPAQDYLRQVRFHDTALDRTEEMRYGVEKLGNTDHFFFERVDQKFHLRPTEVKRGLFLLSDNRDYPGQDSRQFGEVDPERCEGVVFMRWLKPADDDGAELGHGWFDILR